MRVHCDADARRQPALLVAALVPSPCGGRGDEPRHGLSVFGDLKYPRRFQAFRLRQSRRAQGRPRSPRSAPAARTTFDSFNNFILQGRRGARASSFCSTRLMTRANDEPDAVYGLVAAVGRCCAATAARSRSSCGPRPSSPTARRSRPTMSSSRFDILKEKGHPRYRVCSSRDVDEGRGARRRTPCATPSQGDAVARSAADRRRRCRSSRRPTTRRTSSTRRRSSRRSAPAPTRSATSSRARSSPTSAATTIGPRTCPSTAAASISTRCATSTTATARPSSRACKAGDFDLREEFTVARLGDGLRHPGRQGGPARAARRCPTRARPARRASSSTRAAPKFADVRVRKALDSPSTSSGPTTTCSSVSTRAPRASSRTPT